ncbi:hypothetical protein Ocin01_12575 [Orchesella cincta]|uniref:Uncharacterized protein n=1 Tax=Orchesella cincta TaxID=48709 RepID=A0A1D2MMP6_ORCCI|nr:hypothetical protein Ocin01_12575 [Orchesella cincta]
MQRRAIPCQGVRLVIQELDEWDRVCIDVDTVVRQNSQLRNSVATLQQEIATLKDKIKKQDASAEKTQQQKYTKKKHQQRALSSTPIQTIVTPVDSEEEAEQIHQILEDLHNIVNNEQFQDSSATGSVSEIVPVFQNREALPPPPNRITRPTHSEPNLFESENSTMFNESDDESSPRTKVKHVVQQLEQSNLFNTLPNFNTSGLASKFANFKSSKLTSNSNQWGENEGTRVKSLENLDNFTLKWKYPVVGQENETPQQPSSLMVLQDYRMNRFSKSSGKNVPQAQAIVVPPQKNAPSSSSSGIFSKNKKRHVHPQKTFQISLVSKNPNGETKMTNLNYNDLGAAGGGGGNNSGGNGSPERVTDLPSGMY